MGLASRDTENTEGAAGQQSPAPHEQVPRGHVSRAASEDAETAAGARIRAIDADCPAETPVVLTPRAAGATIPEADVDDDDEAEDASDVGRSSGLPLPAPSPAALLGCRVGSGARSRVPVIILPAALLSDAATMDEAAAT